MRYYLAIDIGASSGRHILGWLDGGIIRLEEIHRFPNAPMKRDGGLYWDVDALRSEIVAGLKKCGVAGKVPVSMGIDTWGVDFVLLDKEGNVLGGAAAYRDDRTAGMDAEVFKCVPEDELYRRTGIQRQIFNTIFQLMAVKRKTPELLERAERLFLMPDYLHYLLGGGRPGNEYTIASTTGLLGAASKTWDYEIIERCGFPKHIFQEIDVPGIPSRIVTGNFTDAVEREVGFDCAVPVPPSHDTASAFLAVPAEDDASVYISSGTWSLAGVERPEPVTTEAARLAGFTNEGGYGGRYRFLKNIMGLWMVQEVRREIGGNVDFERLAGMAEASGYRGTVDVTDESFLAPKSMTEAVRRKCREAGHAKPENAQDVLKCIYASLAHAYAKTVKDLERLTGTRYKRVNIIGGGSRDKFLNRLTAEACGLPVHAGPTEGTALGNIVSQMIVDHAFEGVPDARAAIRRSFDVEEVLPCG